MKTQDISMPAFQYTDARDATTARGRAKTTIIAALGDEFIHAEQVLGPVSTFPLDC